MGNLQIKGQWKIGDKVIINDIVYPMNPYTYTISFRAYHPSMDLNDFFQSISKIEGFIPRSIWKVGEDRKDIKGNKLEGKYKDSYCYFIFTDKWQKSDDIELSATLDTLLSTLEPYKTLLRTISQEGKLVFFVGLSIESNSGIQLSLNLLKKLERLDIGIDFDLYVENK